MSKGLEALEDLRHNLNCMETGKGFLKVIKYDECLDTIEKELKKLEELEKAFDALSKENEKVMKELSKEIEKNRAFEIIKKYPRCSLQRYIGFNEMVKDGYELTQEHLFNHDMPCSVEEYNIVIEVLL